jgi:hypothetical protein
MPTIMQPIDHTTFLLLTRRGKSRIAFLAVCCLLVREGEALKGVDELE